MWAMPTDKSESPDEYDDGKYIVFKLREFNRWNDLTGATKRAGFLGLVDDAVVIRLKDPFAATALHTYASAILTVIEILSEHDNISPEDYQRMVDIADYFNSQAMESESIKKKRLPD
jgi:hypothetical protein